MDVINNTALERFEIILGDEIAMAEYTIEGNAIYFTHTEVPEAFEGQGIASQLARTALEFAKEQGYTVYAQCAFFVRYIQRHPEYQPITWGYS